MAFFNNGLKNIELKLRRFAGKNNVFHKSFEIGILVKGIDGILEIAGGILLIFMNPVNLNRLTILLTQHELSEDPKDMVANFLINSNKSFSISKEYFGVLYLTSHGLIKLIIIILLLKKNIWAYPFAVIFLILFIFYQIYRYIISPSAGLVILTVFDVIMIVLTIIEYKRIKV